MKTLTCLLFFLAVISLPCPTRAQTVAPKDATAVGLMNTAVRALSQGVPISSVTLTARVTRTAGSDVETGEATLKALGGVASRIDLTLTNGQRNMIINQSQGGPAGQWSGTDGTIHPMSAGNCWIPASWFFPAFVLAQAVNNPSVAITYIGQETLNGQAVQHVRFAQVFPTGSGSPATFALFEHLSTADIYLDAANSLPVELDFNIHPDNNASLDIPVEIRYGTYQKINGILLPTRIQKLINHSLFLDLNVTGIVINTNLSSGDFAVTATGQ